MKLINKYLALLIIILVGISCTEIIPIDVIASEPEIVVEASIGQGEFAQVILTETVNLYDGSNFPRIENATVRINDDAGKSEILEMTEPGVYVSKNIRGEANRKYTLRIEQGDKIISSESTIPNQVPIDSMRIVNSIYPGGGPPLLPGQEADFYEVYVTYTDPVEEKNYYRILLFVNDKAISRNYINDDRLTNGNQVENFLVVYDPEFTTGGKIRVELQCIDKTVYEYFKSMGNSSMGPGNSSSPANPYTNLTGAILGYFSAHTVESREVVWE